MKTLFTLSLTLSLLAVILVQGAVLPNKKTVQDRGNPTSLHRRAFPSLHGWEDKNNLHKAKLYKIKLGFQDMVTVVNTVLHGTNYDLWYGLLDTYFSTSHTEDCGYDYKVSNWVFAILSAMVKDPATHIGDDYGSSTLSQISLWEEDFDNKDGQSSAYTSHEDSPRMHIGPVGFSPAWAYLGKSPKDKCASFGDEVSKKMTLFATLVVHELTHAKTIMNTLNQEFPQCSSGYTEDIWTRFGPVYGSYRTRFTIPDPNGKGSVNICNADNYAWFVTELYWSIICERTFDHPSKDEW